MSCLKQPHSAQTSHDGPHHLHSQCCQVPAAGCGLPTACFEFQRHHQSDVLQVVGDQTGMGPAGLHNGNDYKTCCKPQQCFLLKKLPHVCSKVECSK